MSKQGLWSLRTGDGDGGRERGKRVERRVRNLTGMRDLHGFYIYDTRACPEKARSWQSTAQCRTTIGHRSRPGRLMQSQSTF